MGVEWKKAQKAINGNPVDFRDLLDGKVTGLSGVVTPTTIVGRSYAPQAGQVDFVLADVSPAVASGSLSIAVYNAGTLLASGDLTSGMSVARLLHNQSSNMGEPKVIASGSVTHGEYKIGTAVGHDGQVSRSLNLRVGLRYRD